MPDIGIIGGGIGGTHLGLFLRQHGVSATIYSAKTPAEHLAARITNVVCRSGTTRAQKSSSNTVDSQIAAPATNAACDALFGGCVSTPCR
jgi:anaerobic glycerol-3-phosphate dehydrogenase